MPCDQHRVPPARAEPRRPRREPRARPRGHPRIRRRRRQDRRRSRTRAVRVHVRSRPTRRASVAIAPDHPVFAEWADAVRDAGAVVVGGFAELGRRRAASTTAPRSWTAPACWRSTARSTCGTRRSCVFTPGSAAPPVVETPVGRLGVLICFDLEFPEMPRTLALGGAELIVAPTNWPLETVPGRRARSRGHGRRWLPPTATTSRSPRCDRVGVERGQDWNGASCIIDEHGWVVATADAAGVVTADLDLSRSHDKTPERTGRRVR